MLPVAAATDAGHPLTRPGLSGSLVSKATDLATFRDRPTSVGETPTRQPVVTLAANATDGTRIPGQSSPVARARSTLVPTAPLLRPRLRPTSPWLRPRSHFSCRISRTCHMVSRSVRHALPFQEAGASDYPRVAMRGPPSLWPDARAGG